MSYRFSTYAVLPLFLLFWAPVSASSIFDLLRDAAGDGPLEATLTYPVDSLHRRTLTPQKANLTFSTVTGDPQNWELKVRVRGKSRLKKCDFPPLKLDFAKEDLEAANLSEFDKYKLVVPCFSGPGAEAAVLREYLAYRAYGIITPLSYRVQLLRLTRRDENGRHPDLVSLAFLIENTKELAARNHSEEIDDTFGLATTDYDPDKEATHAMLQYLIANTDWSNKLNRNLKKVRLKNGLIAPVGYDFDHSGWVGASYATPRRHLGQEYVDDRVYLGYPQTDGVLQKVIANFTNARESLFTLTKHPLLRPKDRRALRATLRLFYQQLQYVEWVAGPPLYDALRGKDVHRIPVEYMPEEFMMH